MEKRLKSGELKKVNVDVLRRKIEPLKKLLEKYNDIPMTYNTVLLIVLVIVVPTDC